MRQPARPPHLPGPYSLDFNPIENAFAKLKALLRKAAARTVDGLWAVISRLVDLFTPQECANYFTAAGVVAYTEDFVPLSRGYAAEALAWYGAP